nr:hypothetical protein [Tanacetum cinerariifolium]
MTSLEDINDLTEVINVALILFAKAFQLTAPTNNNQRTSSNPRNRQNVEGNGGNQFGQLVVVPGIVNQNGTGNIFAARAEGTGNGNQASFVDVPSDLQTELDRTKEKLELCIIKKEKEYGVLWNNCHLKTTYKNLFDFITSNQAHAKLHNLIYENAKLKAKLFENTSESMNNTSGTSVTPQVDKPKLIAVTPYSKKLHASILSHSVPQPREFNVVKHSNMIALAMFKIDPSQTSMVDLMPNNQSSASIRTNSITNFQCHVTFKENVSFDTVNASFTGLVHTARTSRPQPKGNIRNDRVPSASKIVVQIYLWCVDSGCSKHMTRNIKHLINFVWNFLGIDRFGNYHIAAILDIVILNGEILQSSGFTSLKVKGNTCFSRELDGVDLLKGNRSTSLYTINLYDIASASPICL